MTDSHGSLGNAWDAMQSEIDQRQRLANGVRKRIDGGGDDWANAHRGLGRRFYMSDLDAFAGFIVFEKSSEDQVFLEYERHGNDLRASYGYVAFFDRKKVPWSRACTEQVFENSRTMQMDFCRKLSLSQPVAPRLFYVCGMCEPWTLGEWDIVTGKALATWEVTPQNMREVWQSCGLLMHRAQLERWVKGQR